MNRATRTTNVRDRDGKLLATVQLEAAPTATDRAWDVIHHDRRIGTVTRTTYQSRGTVVGTRVSWAATPTGEPTRRKLPTRAAALTHLLERTNR